MKLFIYGSTGDLVKRKVIPALQSLNLEMEIWALGRKDFDDKSYSKLVEIISEKFKKQLHYKKIDFERKAQDYLDLLDKNNINFFYISLPPSMQIGILESLSLIKKKGFKIQILMEKPFASNLSEALKLAKFISANFEEKEIYLADHYLFKKEIVSLKNTDFREIRIISLETLGLENRIGYYDEIGALRDMIQSHFFNILFKILNEPEELSNVDILSFEKGQYGNGKTEGYVSELGKDSKTETFVKLKLKIDDKIITLVTGKAFNKKISLVEIDNKKFNLESGNNSYELMFKNFFEGNSKIFPTIKNAIFSWKLIDKIDKDVSLFYYPKNSDVNKFIYGENKND